MHFITLVTVEVPELQANPIEDIHTKRYIRLLMILQRIIRALAITKILKATVIHIIHKHFMIGV